MSNVIGIIRSFTALLVVFLPLMSTMSAKASVSSSAAAEINSVKAMLHGRSLENAFRYLATRYSKDDVESLLKNFSDAGVDTKTPIQLRFDKNKIYFPGMKEPFELRPDKKSYRYRGFVIQMKNKATMNESIQSAVRMMAPKKVSGQWRLIPQAQAQTSEELTEKEAQGAATAVHGFLATHNKGALELLGVLAKTVEGIPQGATREKCKEFCLIKASGWKCEPDNRQMKDFTIDLIDGSKFVFSRTGDEAFKILWQKPDGTIQDVDSVGFEKSYSRFRDYCRTQGSERDRLDQIFAREHKQLCSADHSCGSSEREPVESRRPSRSIRGG